MESNRKALILSDWLTKDNEFISVVRRLSPCVGLKILAISVVSILYLLSELRMIWFNPCDQVPYVYDIPKHP